MAGKNKSRKYQVTINNPDIHGFTHDSIKLILSGFTSLEYWCMCDEVGKEGTPHTHIYLVATNAIHFSTLQKRFYGAHIEPANGSNQENRDYIRKDGKWLTDEKNETNLIGTFEESGELPQDRATRLKENAAIYELIKNGASNPEVLEEYPNAFVKLDKIDRLRQTFLEEQYKDEFRKLEVTYIWGETGVGKTRGIMEKYGYSNVYRTTNYVHPFDGYKGQDVLIFEEFRSSLPISDMLKYLEGYPINLPCRYADRQACFTKVYIITNIPFEKQYQNIQVDEPETWKAFKRRINYVICQLPPSKDGIIDWTEQIDIEGK